MRERWRILDTGLRSPPQNVALDRALLEARRAEEIPTTLRYRRQTQCVLLGALQSAGHDVDLDCCQKLGVPLQRRITGGPSVYASEAHVGWRLYVQRRELGKADARDILKRLCHAVATAASALERKIESFFASRPAVHDGLAAADFAAVFAAALKESLVVKKGPLPERGIDS